MCTRASAENFSREGRQRKIRPKNSTIKPLPAGEGGDNGIKTEKIAKKDRK